MTKSSYFPTVLLSLILLVTIVQMQNGMFCFHDTSPESDANLVAVLPEPVSIISYTEPCLVYPFNASNCKVTDHYLSSDHRRVHHIVPQVPPLPTENLTLGRRRTAAMCLFVKNELLYINEYIDYHLAIGFDEILVYDNSNDNNLREWVEEVKGPQTNNRTSIIHFPGKNMQELAYRSCYQELVWRNHTWMGNLDVDERLVLKNTEKYPSVIELFEEHLQSGALYISWCVFGPSSHTRYLPMPLAQRFRNRSPGAHDHYKVFGHLATIDPKRIGVHYTSTIQPATCHDLLNNTSVHGVPLEDRVKAISEIAAVYHFWTKSIEEWVVKACWRGRPSTGSKSSINCDLSYAATLNVGGQYDDAAWQALKTFVPEYAILE
ncbi:hypothetical protein ACA910_019103 [Epithemia clementina (nom. ined.)]